MIVNKACLKNGRIPCTIPVLEDIESNTALDVALEILDVNLASAFLMGIENYPFMHCGFILVSGINKAFEKKVAHFG